SFSPSGAERFPGRRQSAYGVQDLPARAQRSQDGRDQSRQGCCVVEASDSLRGCHRGFWAGGGPRRVERRRRAIPSRDKRNPARERAGGRLRADQGFVAHWRCQTRIDQTQAGQVSEAAVCNAPPPFVCAFVRGRPYFELKVRLRQVTLSHTIALCYTDSRSGPLQTKWDRRRA